jgi:hypothetical protein
MADSNDALRELDAFVGEWQVEGTMVDPPLDMGGSVVFEWLEGGGFLLQRSTPVRDEFPNSVSLIGLDEETGEYVMHYFDSRGVSRVFAMTLDDGAWTFERKPSGPRSEFWQRWIGEFSDDGKTIEGRGENSDDGSDWEVDYHLTYTRKS